MRSAWASFWATGVTQFGDRIGPPRCWALTACTATGPWLGRGGSVRALEVEPGDLAGGQAVDQVSPECVELEPERGAGGKAVFHRTLPAPFKTASSPSSVATTMLRPAKSGTACEAVPPRWYAPSLCPRKS